MKISTVITVIMLLLLVNPLFPQTVGTKARIIEEKGDTWKLQKGTADGVTEGMEGYLIKEAYSPRDKKNIHNKIAYFKVSSVLKEMCSVKIVRWNEGFSPKDARYAQFTTHLVPPKGIKKRPRKEKAHVIETGKNSRWYLVKGDEAAKVEKYALALDYYYKALEKDPEDPGAKFRIKENQGKHFVQQGDLDDKDSEYLSAHEYYLMAFELLGDNNFIAAEKILHLWDKDENIYKKTGESKIKPDEIIKSLVNHCDQLLEENQLETLSTLAQKIKNYAKNDPLKSKLDTFIKAKEIQLEIDAGDYKKIISSIKIAIEKNNLYKASYIIKKLDNMAIDDETKTQLMDLTEQLRVQNTKIQLQQAKKRKEDKIKQLKEEARAFVELKQYDEAIDRYKEIQKLEPDKTEYSEKTAKLQMEKFKHEKFQKEIDARVESGNLILHADDYFQKDLMQDALDYYIKAFKIFPEQGKAVAGVAKVLENCSADDAKFITPALLERKLTKFTKDFLNYVEKNYLNSKDEKGFEILSKIGFITNNKNYDALMIKIKDNLYAKNLALGHDRFKIADFDQAVVFYQKAQGFKDTPKIKIRLEVCSEVKKITGLLERERKKELSAIFEAMLTLQNKYEILEGLLNQSNKYLDNLKFKKAKYLYKKVGDFQVYKFKERISALKKKHKELKKKQK